MDNKWPKKTKPRANKKVSQKQWKNKGFEHRRLGQKKRTSGKPYGFLKTLKNLRKSMVFVLQNWQRANATQGDSHSAARNCARKPSETLEFLVFPDGPWPGNGLRPGMSLATHAKPYGFLKTLEILGNSYNSTRNCEWPIE